MTLPLTVKRMSYNVGPRVILDDLSFALREGECSCLLGANGAGKTSLLRLLLGLLKPHKGDIIIQGRPIGSFTQRQLAQAVAYVPQSHTPAFPYLVKDVVQLAGLAQSPFGLRKGNDETGFVVTALESLAIAHLAERRYTELSGGERQAVLLARALAQKARILILDEPETGLDYGQQKRFLNLLRRLASEGYCILTTTHDPLRARDTFDRALLLADGKIIGDGPAKDIINDEMIARIYKT